jgi:hypothetical protein
VDDEEYYKQRVSTGREKQQRPCSYLLNERKVLRTSFHNIHERKEGKNPGAARETR